MEATDVPAEDPAVVRIRHVDEVLRLTVRSKGVTLEAVHAPNSVITDLLYGLAFLYNVRII